MEAVVYDQAATLCLYGALSRKNVRQLEAVLDGIISCRPGSLTVDLSDAGTVSRRALCCIKRRQKHVERLVVRAPSSKAT